MIRVVNDSDNYTDFSMLEEGDVFYWTKYDGYFMKVVASALSEPSVRYRYNAVSLNDGHLYLVSEDAEIIKAHSAKLTVDM